MRKLTIILLFVLSSLALAEEGTTTGAFLEDFQPEKRIKKIEKSFSKGKPLKKTLDKASAELATMIKEYRKNPTAKLKGKIEEKFSGYARTIVGQVSDMLGERDAVKWSIKGLKRDLEDVSTRLAGNTQQVTEMIKAKGKEAAELKKELRKLARQIKQQPDNEEELREKFRRKLRALQVLSAHAKALKAQKANLVQWRSNMRKLSGLMGRVGDHMDLLFDYLKDQNKTLKVAMKTHKDIARIQNMLSGSIKSSGVSIKGIAVSTAELNRKLKNFQDLVGVMTDISAGTSPGSIGGKLQEVEHQLNSGMPTNFDTSDKALDKYIDMYSEMDGASNATTQN